MKNKVSLIGRVGNDVELKELSNGKVCNFSLATTEKWRDKEGNKKEDTQWHSMQAWGATAELAAKYVKKGDKIAIDGKIKYREFNDKEGKKRYATEIVIEDMIFLEGKREGQ